MALANVAHCCLHMQEYEAGLDSIRDAVGLKDAPETPAEMLNRVFAEGTYTRLLLATGRVAEASERAQIARELATKSQVSAGRYFRRMFRRASRGVLGLG